jgi:hypothetical protein
MKHTNILRFIPYALCLTTPLFLTGCEGLGDFGNSSASSNYDRSYDYNNAAPRASVSTQGAPVVRTEATSTSLADPVTSTPTTPKLTTSTTNAAKSAVHDGPSVPNMAPTIGQ